jgi:hypothetical protein
MHSELRRPPPMQFKHESRIFKYIKINMAGDAPTYTAPTSLRALLAEPKGKKVYAGDEAFLLHVFWMVPSPEAARTLIAGLSACAKATHRDTPCVPTYFFREYSGDEELCPPPPICIGELPALKDALRKISRGVPVAAVWSELSRKGVDPALLELPSDSPLPVALSTRAVCVELTEVYLDERAFVEHSGSRDYLDGYGAVMDPAHQLGGHLPRTIRIGSPTTFIVEKILEPALKEEPQPLVAGCAVWDATQATAAAPGAAAVFLSMDTALSPEAAAAALQGEFRAACCTLVTFVHPLREGVTRILAVLPQLPSLPVLARAAEALLPLRGAAHVTGADDAAVADVASVLVASGLGSLVVNGRPHTGYVLHRCAGEIRRLGAACAGASSAIVQAPL